MTNENEQMNNEQLLILKQKSNYFYKHKIPVHITYKNHTSWKNGIIKELGDDFFLLKEREEGIIPIFYLEIKNIVEFTK